jgi:guanylate kinase
LKEGKFIVVSAPSGSGKTTLVRTLLSENLPLSFSISATSREPRGDEINGVDYHFLSTIEFKNHIKQEAFIEYEEVYPNKFYGSLKTVVERNWKSGNHVIFDIDVIGALNIKKKYPNQTLSIFINPPSINVLEERLRSRGTESETALLERIQKANEEIKFSEKFDKSIINDDLEKSKKQIIKVVKDFIDS